MKPKLTTKRPLHPREMNPGTLESVPNHSLPSHYNGDLASNRFFSQKEINSKPAKRINATLAKKSGPEIKRDQFGADFDELESMRLSATSFNKSNNEIEISQEQKERIRSRPFSGKFKSNRITEEKHEAIEEAEDLVSIDRENFK
jgi:hypothetical protein